MRPRYDQDYDHVAIKNDISETAHRPVRVPMAPPFGCHENPKHEQPLCHGTLGTAVHQQKPRQRNLLETLEGLPSVRMSIGQNEN